ncbi:interferon gamma receptor 1 isoform X2 [Salarias fasciatus]|uniref:interferon gamma receptor 1 isoform X2 n=1 Tax=Salarias fasciatus TaxID=181472 RepID=UPI001176D8E2|nr:interferon gamma receptor 1-like isoform X2 [Salarias fasciatus]
MRTGGAFRALLVLLVISVSAAGVPPPENVLVSCRNAAVTVSWDYSKQQPETRFGVSIHGRDGIFDQTETTDRRIDLSYFVWGSQQHCLDFLYVQVKALQGSTWSENKTSNSFSFNNFMTVHTKCSLEFPPVDVDVDVDAGKATVTFDNPVHHYKEVKQVNRALPQFSFTISPVENGTKRGGDVGALCMASDPICRADVPLPEDVKPCFVLKGALFDGLGINSVTVRPTEEICATESVESQEVILAVILTTVALFFIIMGVLLICKVKAWTLKDKPGEKPCSLDSTRSSITSKDSGHSRKDSGLPETYEDRGADLDASHAERPFYLDRALSESSSQNDSGSAGSSEETDSVLLVSDKESEEEDTPVVSNYDRPHVHKMDMGDGDIVEGYGGN